jgi:peroxiredoxin Q/BCP
MGKGQNNMLKVGERAPEFTLPDETGKDRSLTELLSSGAIILYFYPADFTPGCTRQACKLRDLHSEIQKAGLRVVGISPQSPASHAKFREKYRLPFDLLSDEHKAVVKMYGLNGPLGIGVRRASYLIDGSRRVRDAVLADLRIGRHMDFVRKAIMLRAASN